MARALVYLICICLAVLATVSAMQGKFLSAGAAVMGIGYCLAATMGLIPDAWRQPSSKAGNVVAPILAAILVITIVIVGWLR